MFLKLYRRLSRISSRALLFTLPVLFCATWFLMWRFEGPVPIVSPGVYWWYFIVTAATVGYGDFTPVTLGGRIVGATIMLGGIGILAGLLGKIAESVIRFSKWRESGMLPLDAKDHIVVFGYRKGETEEVFRELLADIDVRKTHVVLCSSSEKTNPLLRHKEFKTVEFVHGDLSSEDVMKRACVGSAAKVVVHGHSDDQTFAVGVAANAEMQKSAHMVAYFHDPHRASLLQKVNPHIKCQSSLSVPLLVLETQEPGSTEIVRQILSHLDGDTAFRCDIPKDVTSVSYMDMFVFLKRKYNAVLIGTAESHDRSAKVKLNSEAEPMISGGMSIFYVAPSRLKNINWFEAIQV